MHDDRSGSHRQRRECAHGVGYAGNGRRAQIRLNGKGHPKGHDGQADEQDYIPLQEGKGVLFSLVHLSRWLGLVCFLRWLCFFHRRYTSFLM